MNKFALALALSLPMMAQDYKIAVVGLVHSHVWGHLKKLVDGTPGAKLIGIAEPNPALVAEARKLGWSGPYFDDYRKMIADQKPDIVWAFVENNRHLEIIQACAPKKISVIFEKPLASTYAEAKQIRELARKNDIQILTNYQMAWWPANYAAKAQADQGAIGKVWRLRGIVGHGGPGSEGPRNQYFFDWLTDPVKNGAGSLMDFECYNALWSLWYLGRPEKVYAQVNHMRPERFPKVEDNADMILSYPNGVGIFEGSWDLPRSYQDLEVFGLGGGSLYMQNGKVEMRKGKDTTTLDLQPLAADRADPAAYMVSCLRDKKPVDGLTALDINVQVLEIIDAAKESVRTGRAIVLAGK